MTTTLGRSSTVTITGRTAILVIVLISYFMILLDNSIIFTGLPKVQTDLGFSTVGLSWVQSAYALVFGGLLLLGARSGDILGRRRMFVIGLLIFAAASLVISLAPTAAWLVSARAVQGIGSAILAPTTLSLLTANFPEGRERTRAIAAYGAVAGIGASLGLVLGGVFADLLSWRVGFFINVPIGLAMAMATLRWIPETRRVPSKFDLVGALCSTLGMTALVDGILRSATHGWTDPVTIAAFAFGTVLLVLLVVNEAHARQPIMPLRLFASRRRAGAYLTRLLYMAAMLPFFFFTTQFLQRVLGYNPLQAGLAFLPMTLVNFAVAVAIPRLTARFGNTTLLAVGVVVTFVGMAWLSRLGVDSAYVTAVALPMVLIGIGQGLAFAPMTSAGMTGVAPADVGAASGMVSVAHQFGGSLGIGILTAVAAGGSASAVGTRNVLAEQVSMALTGAAVSLAIAVALQITLLPQRLPSRRREAAGEQLMSGSDAGCFQRACGADHLHGQARPQDIEAADAERAADHGPASFDEAQHAPDGNVRQATSHQCGSHDVDLLADPVDQIGAVATSNNQPLDPWTEHAPFHSSLGSFPLVALGVEDENAGRPDSKMVDVGPGSRDAPVVQDPHPLARKGI